MSTTNGISTPPVTPSPAEGKVDFSSDHLGSDQNVDLTGPKQGQSFLKNALFLNHVSIQSSDSNTRESIPNRLLDTLGPGSEWAQFQSATRWAIVRSALLIIAVVALQQVCPLMIR